MFNNIKKVPKKHCAWTSIHIENSNYNIKGQIFKLGRTCCLNGKCIGSPSVFLICGQIFRCIII